MAAEDYRINAQVRAVLVQRNVDLARVEFGTTRGVVYVRGSLAPFYHEQEEDQHSAKMSEASLANKIELILRRLPGVRDVIFKLDRVQKVGWKWRPR